MVVKYLLVQSTLSAMAAYVQKSIFIKTNQKSFKTRNQSLIRASIYECTYALLHSSQLKGLLSASALRKCFCASHARTLYFPKRYACLQRSSEASESFSEVQYPGTSTSYYDHAKPKPMEAYAYASNKTTDFNTRFVSNGFELSVRPCMAASDFRNLACTKMFALPNTPSR